MLKKLLEKAGANVIPLKFAVDYHYDNYEKLRAPLAKADILLLCHGSKYDNTEKANCDSFVAIIELFKSVHDRKLVPLEVWGVGSEIECLHFSHGSRCDVSVSRSLSHALFVAAWLSLCACYLYRFCLSQLFSFRFQSMKIDVSWLI